MPTSPCSASPEKNVHGSNREENGVSSAPSRPEYQRIAEKAPEQEVWRYVGTTENTPVKDNDNELSVDCYRGNLAKLVDRSPEIATGGQQVAAE